MQENLNLVITSNKQISWVHQGLIIRLFPEVDQDHVQDQTPVDQTPLGLGLNLNKVPPLLED